MLIREEPSREDDSMRSTPSMPSVPLFSDAGLAGFDSAFWYGLVAPAGTPADVIQKLNQAFVAALNDPDTRQRFGRLMAEPTPTSPSQFGQFMDSERKRYEAVVKQSGAKVD